MKNAVLSMNPHDQKVCNLLKFTVIPLNAVLST